MARGLACAWTRRRARSIVMDWAARTRLEWSRVSPRMLRSQRESSLLARGSDGDVVAVPPPRRPPSPRCPRSDPHVVAGPRPSALPRSLCVFTAQAASSTSRRRDRRRARQPWRYSPFLGHAPGQRALRQAMRLSHLDSRRYHSPASAQHAARMHVRHPPRPGRSAQGSAISTRRQRRARQPGSAIASTAMAITAPFAGMCQDSVRSGT
jgi:hypothetical protein